MLGLAKLGIRTKLQIIISFSLLVPSIIIGVIAYIYAQKMLTEKLALGFHSNLTVIQERIENQLNGIAETATYWSLSKEMSDINNPENKITSLLDNLKKESAFINHMVVFNRSMLPIAATDPDYLPKKMTPEMFDNFAPISAEYLEEDASPLERVLANGKPLSLFSNATEENFMILPIIDTKSKETMGALLVTFDLNVIGKTIQDLRNGIVAGERINLYFTGSGELISAVEVIEAGVDYNQIIESGYLLTEKLSHIKLKGDKFIALSLPIKNGLPGMMVDLHITALQKQSVAYRATIELAEYLILSGIILAICFSLLGAYFVQHFLQPILGLTAITEEILTDEDLSKRVEVTNFDEIGSLQENFNLLLKNVEESKVSLELEKNYASSIVNSLSNGLVVIDQSLEIIQCFSQTAKYILGDNLEGRNILDVLFPDVEVTRQVPKRDRFQGCLAAAFNLIISEQFSDLKSTAPKTLKFLRKGNVNDACILGVELSPVVDSNDQITHIIVSFGDVTELEKLKKGVDFAHEQSIASLAQLEKLLFDPSLGRHLYESLEELLDLSKTCQQLWQNIEEADLNALFRKMHTVKGGTSNFQLSYLSYFAHVFETTIADLRDGKITLEDIDMEQMHHHVASILGGLHSLKKILDVQFGNVEDDNESITAPWDAWILGVHHTVSLIAADLQKEARFFVQSDVALTGKDLSLFKRIMIHLIRNAVDHGLESPQYRIDLGKKSTGSIHLEIEDRGLEIVLIFKDNGGGINKRMLCEKASEKGLGDFQPDTMTNEDIVDIICSPGFTSKAEVTDFSGRGVGMNSVRHDIRSAGGDIELMETSSRGTSFTIRWPKMDQTVVDIPFAQDKGILIVDDESDYRNVLEEIITMNFDIPIYQAGNVAEAEAVLHREKVGIVISDLSMPDGSGFRLLDFLNENFKDISTIVISGYIEERNMDLLQDISSHFFTKPVDIEAFEDTISSILRSQKRQIAA